MKRVWVCALAFGMSGCSMATNPNRTAGELASGYGYIPLDGLAVQIRDSDGTGAPPDKSTKFVRRPLPDVLPDITVRFAVASFTADGGLSFGPVKITEQNQSYRAILDYVNVDEVPVEFYIRKFVVKKGSQGPPMPRRLSETVDTSLERVVSYEANSIPTPAIAHTGDSITMAANATAKRIKYGIDSAKYDQVTIPVYVGIGMRLSADIRALQGKLALTSLGSIAADAEAKTLSGTLTVQTIGVSGKAVATILPLPNKLDETTIENGILAIGSGRAGIYTDATLTPRIVGLYSPVGSDPLLINAIYAELSRQRPIWVWPNQPAPSSVQAPTTTPPPAH